MNSGSLSVTNTFGVPNCEKSFLHLFVTVDDLSFLGSTAIFV